MGIMVSEVYEALIEAGVSEAKAKAAAEAIPVKEQMATKQDIAFLKEEIAAEKGDAKAQYSLGVMYDLGLGVSEDAPSEAVKWFRKAAEQGNAEAQVALGHRFREGRGVEKDDREAAKWYRKAAEQGDASSQARLGGMYCRGEGVPKDFVKAYAWLNLAAAQGAKFAKFAAVTRDRLAAKTSNEQVAAAQQLSAELWERIESSKPESPPDFR